MGEQTKRFVVVVGIDFSEQSQEALRVAVGIARAGNGVLHLVHIDNPMAMLTDGPERAIIDAGCAEAREKLAALHVAVLASAGIPVTAHVEVGAATDLLPAFAARVRADLVVVGTHGRHGISRLVFGSVAEAVTRNAPCSVLTVRPRVLGPEELIEPPCPGCVEATRSARAAGKGAATCEQHTRHHPRAHTYSALPDGFGLGSQSFQFPAR